MKVIAWGCGVQSTTMAVMSALGDLPPVDLVLHSDTGWERRATYEARDFYADWLRSHGVKVRTISAGNIRGDQPLNYGHMPFWTASGAPLRRQCTRHFKLDPAKRAMREALGFHASKPPHPQAGAIENWIGFSWDELGRMSESRIKFIANRYPLIERRMTRRDCVEYLRDHGLPVPTKSACVGCPYRSASEWADMRDNAPDEFADACAVDADIRRKLPNDKMTADEIFMYRYCKPLSEANLDEDAKREREYIKVALFSDIPCGEGYCWV